MRQVRCFVWYIPRKHRGGRGNKSGGTKCHDCCFHFFVLPLPMRPAEPVKLDPFREWATYATVKGRHLTLAWLGSAGRLLGSQAPRRLLPLIQLSVPSFGLANASKAPTLCPCGQNLSD